MWLPKRQVHWVEILFSSVYEWSVQEGYCWYTAVLYHSYCLITYTEPLILPMLPILYTHIACNCQYCTIHTACLQSSLCDVTLIAEQVVPELFDELCSYPTEPVFCKV